MSRWKKKLIGNVIQFNPKIELKKGSTAKKVAMPYIGEFQRKINGYEMAEYKSGPKFLNGDVILAKINPSLENGKAAKVDILERNEVAFGSTEFIVLRETDESDANFIYYLVVSPAFRKKAIGCMEGTSGRRRVNENALKFFELPFPKKDEQQRIGEFLSGLDDKIEVNNKINAELESMAKLMYDYWFVQFDFPNENGKPYKSSGGKMVFNEELKREIPKSWEVKPLTKEMDLQYGFPFSTKLFNSEKNGVPVIRIRDIQNGSISYYSTEDVDDKYKLEKRDILVGMDGNFHINYWNSENCYLNQRCLRIRSTQESISEIQARYMIEPYIKAREKNVSKTTVAHLSARDVNDLKVLIAQLELQNKANKFFKSTLNKIVSNREQNQKLIGLRDWLLPMLMNGQVTVGEAKQKLSMVAEEKIKYGE